MKITVITVCFNSVKTIERTIKSVLAQNYSELEYIIIDGGSTDGTLDIIRKYKENLSVWISEPDDGLYDAMNKGLAKATGEVFAFLNSDDYYTENVLERVNEYFKTDDVDMVSGNMYICAEGTVKKAVYDKSNRENLFFGVVYPHPALFAKRELYIKYGGFDTSYKIAADSDWVMKVCLNGAKVICVEDYFTYFSDGGISSRKQYLALEEEYRMALKYAKLSAYAHMEKRVREFYPAQLKMVERRERKTDASGINTSTLSIESVTPNESPKPGITLTPRLFFTLTICCSINHSSLYYPAIPHKSGRRSPRLQSKPDKPHPSRQNHQS